MTRVLLIDGEWKQRAYGSVLAAPGFEFVAVRSTDFAGMAPDPRFDAILLDDDYGSPANARLPEWSESGIPSVQVADGIIDWRNSFEYSHPRGRIPIQRFYPALADVVICIGSWQAQWLRLWGAKCAIAGGLPRLDHYAQASRASQPSGHTTRVLVCSANTPGFDDHQLVLARAAFQDLQIFSAGPGANGLEFEWRIPEAAARSLQLDFPPVARITAAEQIARNDVVITQPSTLALEAMALGKPTATLDYGRYPRLLLSAFEIAHRDDLPETIRAMQQASSHRLAHQDRLLGLQCRLDGHASDRVLEVLARIGGARRKGIIAPGDLAELFRDLHETPEDGPPCIDSPEQERLAREVTHLRNALSESHQQMQRVLNSKSWRALQAVRRWLP